MRLIPILVLIPLVGCKVTDSDKPIELGHIHSASSDDGYLAVKLAADELNADPGRLPQGRRIQIRDAAGGSKPDEWGAQATRLISLNHVAGIISVGRPEDAAKIGVAVQSEGAIAIATGAWSTAPAPNLFTVGLAPVERGRVLAEFANAKKPKTVLIVRDSANKSATAAADRFVAELSSPEIRVTEIDVAAADKPQAEAVFFACSTRVAIEYRPKNALLLFGDEPADLIAAGSAADGIVVAAAYHAGIANERLRSFVQQFQKAHGRAPSEEGVLAHDALSIWADAARRANSLDAAAIRSELLKRDRPFDSLTGPLTFADDRTARRPIFVGPIVGGRFNEVVENSPGPAK
jgi:ABC-type branched-subunit amino acid transport system substrate-binding protein